MITSLTKEKSFSQFFSKNCGGLAGRSPQVALRRERNFYRLKDFKRPEQRAAGF